MTTDRNDRSTIADVARRAGLTYDEGRRFVEAILDELNLGREVRLQGLGVFRLSLLAPRTVHTPILPSGVATYPERRVIRFRRSPTAADKLNPKDDVAA